MNYKEIIAKNVALDGITYEEILLSIEQPQDLKMGDFSLPCFRFSKKLRLAPNIIADNIKAALSALENSEYFCDIQAISGYVNFKISREGFVKNQLNKCLAKGQNFEAKENNGKTICIDYSSINIAKPFHIGHLLTTVIGGSLYRIYKFLGYNVVGINHLGDWGTQFGKLIVAYKKWGNDEDIEKRNINALLELYVKFHSEAEKDESLNDEARLWFKKIEDGNSEAMSIFLKFKETTLKEVDKVYERIGVKFDSYNGESFYNDKLSDIVTELENKKLLTDSKGAKVVDLSVFDMPPCLILKSDGASLYATRDIAAAKYRKDTYNFDKSLYIVAYQQNLHFNQFFKVLELMGYEWAKDCVHVPFGMVSLENQGALSTRKGNVVFLKDVLDTAVEKTKLIIDTKNPNAENKEQIANDVGVGAVIFLALSTSRIKDMVFSYEKALNFEGETSPYIQYTHARCCSILKKQNQEQENFANLEIDYSSLTDDETFDVIKKVALFDEVVLSAAEKYEPSIISRYLIDLAQSFNRFYITHKVVGDSARIAVTNCVKNTLKNGLGLILINAPQQM